MQIEFHDIKTASKGFQGFKPGARLDARNRLHLNKKCAELLAHCGYNRFSFGTKPDAKTIRTFYLVGYVGSKPALTMRGNKQKRFELKHVRFAGIRGTNKHYKVTSLGNGIFEFKAIKDKSELKPKT